MLLVIQVSAFRYKKQHIYKLGDWFCWQYLIFSWF